MPFVPIKMSAPKDNYLDVALAEDHILILDSNGYLWSCGTYSGDGTDILQSSPVLSINDRKYIKLVPTSSMALDESSYAWGWGVGFSLGVQTGGVYHAPQSVLGGRQWTTLENSAGSGGKCGLDSNSYAWAWGSNGFSGNQFSSSSPISVVGGLQFIQISAGYDCVLALDGSSYAWSWGYNANGQLGDNTIQTKSSPISIIGNRQFKSVHTSTYTSYAFDGSSYLWAWGMNSWGQLGDNTALDKSSPVSLGVFDEVYPCGYWNFAKKNNQWYAWGTNKSNQYGNGNIRSFSQPTAINFPFKIKKIIKTHTSNMVTAALDEDGNIWSWGPNMSGGLGTNDAVNKSFPGKVVPIGQYSNDRYTPPGDFIKYITNNRTGGSLKGVSIIINTSSYAWAWGGNSGGWLANNTMAISSSPISIIGNLQFMDLAITKAESGATDPCHILGLDISSYAWAWGENTHGQLGDNTTTYMSDAFSFIYTSFNNRSSPVSVVGGKQWIKLLAGNFHSVGLDLSSYVWCWGDNTYGQLGDGSRTLSSSPVSVLGGIQAIDIAAGLTHSVLLSNSSYVWAWGANTYGQLGINSIVNYSSPVSVIGNQQFKQITSNCANSIWGLNLSSYVWSWGNNSNGILGNNVTANSSSPISVIGNRQFIYVTGSVYSVVALNASSYAWSWGNNGYAQLGDYSTVSKSSPVSVVGGYQWSNIDIGSSQIGVQSYPNSIIVACGSNADNRMTNYLSYIYNLSSPVAIVTKHSYLRPIPANWKNILGK